MITCQNCGNTNAYGTNFCRTCGARIAEPQAQNNSQLPEPHRPYMWKTDEYPAAKTPARNTQEIKQVEPLYSEAPTVTFKPAQFSQMAPPQAAPVAHYGAYCPRCGSSQTPMIARQISTGGWIVFAVFLVFFFPLFWVGLLIKENVMVCPTCSYKLS